MKAVARWEDGTGALLAPPCPGDRAYTVGGGRRLRTHQLTQTPGAFLLLLWQHHGQPLPSVPPSSQEAWGEILELKSILIAALFIRDCAMALLRPGGRWRRSFERVNADLRVNTAGSAQACLVDRECALFRGWAGAMRRIHLNGKKEAERKEAGSV